MKVTFKPRTFDGQSSWEPKMQGVIFVKSEEDIDKLWKVLCEQDDYWESYKKLIKVLPEGEFKDETDFIKYCDYVGKTDIYDVKSVREKVDFMIYQYREDYGCF